MICEKELNKENLSPFKGVEKLINAIDNRSCTKPVNKVRFLWFYLFFYGFI